MFRERLYVAGILLLTLVCSTLLAQSAPPKHPARPKVVGLAKWEPQPQQVSAPYWTLEPGWNTELEVRNNLAQRELKVTPVLRTAAGLEIPLQEVTLASEQVLSINLQSAVSQVDPGAVNHMGSFGSVVFRFSGLNAGNLFAASLVRREGHPIEFHFDGSAVGAAYKSGGIEGIWWLPKETSSDYLILSNPSEKLVKGSLKLTSPSGPARQIPLSIGPGQTARVDIREELGPSANGQMGGLSLSLPNGEALSSSEIAFDETMGLAAMLKLFERDADGRVSAHLLRAPMMALTQPDPALAFPEGTTLVPRIFLWNASSSPLPLSANVDWRSESISGSYKATSLKLTPGQVRVLDLGALQSAGSLPAAAQWSTITLAYTGRAADLVAVALSYDKTSRYGLQTPFTEGTQRLFKGSMWHVDATHNTLITTGNGGSEPTAAEVTLFYNDGKSRYRVEKLLKPGQQLWFNLGELIRNQIPDSDGHTIPPDTMTGSYELRDLDHAYVGELYEGKLVIDKTYGHAAYGCASCCGYHNVVLTPSPFSGPPGINNSDFIDATEQCGGFVDDVTNAGYYWQSSNPAVATLPTRTLHTVAVGTATGGAQIQLQGEFPVTKCPIQTHNPQQPVTVVCAVPTNYNQTSGTGDNSTGVINFDYAWNSSTGKLSDLASCSVKEVVTYPGGNPFVWPSPPFVANQSTPNPTSPPPIAGSDGAASDSHGHPGFQKPYQAASFTATQYYQYVCPCANGGQPVNLMGPLYIFRSVQNSGGTWTYTVTKSGVSATETIP